VTKPSPEKSPVQLFDLLLDLLLSDDMPEAEVARRLRPYIRGSRKEPERLGRRYLISQGDSFTLTATFEQPAFHLYQVTVRLNSAAFAQIKAHAVALPADRTHGAEWKNEWLGLAPKLTVRKGPDRKNAVVARFLGLLPRQKFIVLTRR
jgi:hypothetical protein